MDYNINQMFHDLREKCYEIGALMERTDRLKVECLELQRDLVKAIGDKG